MVQTVSITMGTNCAPLVADFFLFCFERGSMASLSYDKKAEIIQAFNSTFRYLDDLLNIDSPYFESMVGWFLCPATKSGGVLCYTLRTLECLSVCLSVRQRLIIRVRSITLIPLEIIS